MTLPVRLSTRAQRDVERLTDFLEGKSPHAARRAARRIREEVLGLGRFSDRGRPISIGLRELPFRFGASGYVIQYRVDADAVVVARVFHMREDRRGSGG